MRGWLSVGRAGNAYEWQGKVAFSDALYGYAITFLADGLFVLMGDHTPTYVSDDQMRMQVEQEVTRAEAPNEVVPDRWTVRRRP
jgi:hypothetical protein